MFTIRIAFLWWFTGKIYYASSDYGWLIHFGVIIVSDNQFCLIVSAKSKLCIHSVNRILCFVIMFCDCVLWFLKKNSKLSYFDVIHQLGGIYD